MGVEFQENPVSTRGVSDGIKGSRQSPVIRSLVLAVLTHQFGTNGGNSFAASDANSSADFSASAGELPSGTITRTKAPSERRRRTLSSTVSIFAQYSLPTAFPRPWYQ